MRMHVQRLYWHSGQTRFGVFSNLWPTELCKVDRQTLRVWYVDIHVWPFYVWLTGDWRS